MVVTLALPDDLYMKYGERGDPRKAMISQLERFKEVAPTDRVLLLHGDDRRALEAIFQKKLEGVEDLVRQVTRLASVQVGDVAIPLSPSQLKRLDGEAKFFKEPLPTYTEKKLREAVRSATGGV